MLITIPKILNNFTLGSELKIDLSYYDKNLLNNNFRILKVAIIKKITSSNDKDKILINFLLSDDEREKICFYIKNRTKELIIGLNKS